MTDKTNCAACGRDLFVSHAKCVCQVCCPIRNEPPPDPRAVERRRHLLARMAGNVAPGLLAHMNVTKAGSLKEAARAAVELAEAIVAELERRYP